MKKMNSMLVQVYVMACNGWDELRRSERGDTNFVSMLLIIGIVVVLATLFLTLGKGVMEKVSQMVTNFLNGLGA